MQSLFNQGETVTKQQQKASSLYILFIFLTEFGSWTPPHTSENAWTLLMDHQQESYKFLKSVTAAAWQGEDVHPALTV